MKRFLLVASIFVFMASIALFGDVIFAVGETGLPEINASIEAIVQADRLLLEESHKEIYQLFYDGERLIAQGECDQEDVRVFEAYKTLYKKQKAKADVAASCDDLRFSVIVNKDCRYYYEKQYSKVLEYRETLYNALDEEDADVDALIALL